MTLLIAGFVCCFIAVSFRFGVLCTLIANAFFCAVIVIPNQITAFVERNGFADFFTISPEELRLKAVVTALVIMVFLWSVRWFKHLVIEGVFYFLFPQVIKPEAPRAPGRR